METKQTYKRILLKLSGKPLGGEKGWGIDFAAIEKLAKQIREIKRVNNIEIAIVIGGGNIFRGREAAGTKVDAATADYMGMTATLINALALQEALERLGTPTRVLTGITAPSLAEPFIRRRATRHLEKGRVVILAGGTGNPFFTTDTAAALRACELKCDVILKVSDVDGVYDSDPRKNPKARKFKTLTYREALEKHLKVMDNTAFAFCQKHKIPIIVFKIDHLKKIKDIVNGRQVGTKIEE